MNDPLSLFTQTYVIAQEKGATLNLQRIAYNEIYLSNSLRMCLMTA